MLNSNHKLLGISVLFAFAVSAVAVKPQEVGSTTLGWAQEFLGAFYPEMKEHRYVVTATTSEQFGAPFAMRNIKLQIGEFAPGTVLGAATVVNGVVTPRQPKQFITAVFTFDASGHLFTFASEGPAVGKHEEYDRVEEAVRSHPEWTEKRAISALMEAGASYGPTEREKILQLIPVGQLEKLFGSASIVSSEFESLTEGGPPRLPLLCWAVTIKAEFPDGTEQPYKMYFEPFKGALVQMEALRN